MRELCQDASAVWLAAEVAGLAGCPVRRRRSPRPRRVSGRYTLDEFGTARRSTVVRGFIDALTRGGPGGTGAPRPIEMHSHDPLRYGGARRRARDAPWKGLY